jgi:hypothetical protein
VTSAAANLSARSLRSSYFLARVLQACEQKMTAGLMRRMVSPQKRHGEPWPRVVGVVVVVIRFGDTDMREHPAPSGEEAGAPFGLLEEAEEARCLSRSRRG